MTKKLVPDATDIHHKTMKHSDIGRDEALRLDTLDNNRARHSPLSLEARPAQRKNDPGERGRTIEPDSSKNIRLWHFDASDNATKPLDHLTDRARGYVEAANSNNTRKAYASDWRHYTAWCHRQDLAYTTPNPQTVALYITACASGTTSRLRKLNSVATIERRLSALAWNYAQNGTPLERKDRHIATVLAGIRNTHAAPPHQKEAILPEDLIAMLETLDRSSLRGLRDRAMLLIGFTGALRRSEIVGLDLGRDQSEDGRGWIEIFNEGMLVILNSKTGWREVEIGRGSSNVTCPVLAIETWVQFAKLVKGPLFRRVTSKGQNVGPNRLNDKAVARLVKSTVLTAGVRGDLNEAERALKFSGHSLRAGLASSAEVDERYIQKQLGHTSAEMTRKYQRRRDRFRVNLTKASGL